ncbi:MAG: hypothetical protein ACLQCB_06065 [Spirochaetia bacterium]
MDGGETLSGRLSPETTADWDVELFCVALDAVSAVAGVLGVAGEVVVLVVVWPGCWQLASQTPRRPVRTRRKNRVLLNTRGL